MGILYVTLYLNRLQWEILVVCLQVTDAEKMNFCHVKGESLEKDGKHQFGFIKERSLLTAGGKGDFQNVRPFFFTLFLLSVSKIKIPH